MAVAIELMISVGELGSRRGRMHKEVPVEIVKHLLRTLIHIAVLAIVFGGIIVLTIKLRLPMMIIPVGVVVLLGGYIYWSARWHAYWAPVSKKVMGKKWNLATGEAMETVVENAIIQAGGSVQTVTLRLSIYNLETGRRVFRRCIGDDVVFLGVHGMGIWFFIEDRFHARRDGLVCVDVQTGEWIYHVPKSEIRSIEKGKKNGQVFAEMADGEVRELPLAEVTGD